LETGERREGMFGAIYWWMVKLGLSLAFALSGFLLKWTGYDVIFGGAQSAQTFMKMRLVDVFVPATACIIAIVAVYRYKLTEERSFEIREALDLRHANLNEGATTN